VASTTSLGAAASKAATSGAAAITCSQLSSTSSRWRGRSASWSRAKGGRSPWSGRPRACMMAGTTWAASRRGASATNTAPSAKSPATMCAASSARRVFPAPPGPLNVRSRTSPRRSSAVTSATSWSRPISESVGDGIDTATGGGSAAAVVARCGRPSGRRLSPSRAASYTARVSAMGETPSSRSRITAHCSNWRSAAVRSPAAECRAMSRRWTSSASASASR